MGALSGKLSRQNKGTGVGAYSVRRNGGVGGKARGISELSFISWAVLGVDGLSVCS